MRCRTPESWMVFLPILLSSQMDLDRSPVEFWNCIGGMDRVRKETRETRRR